MLMPLAGRFQAPVWARMNGRGAPATRSALSVLSKQDFTEPSAASVSRQPWFSSTTSGPLMRVRSTFRRATSSTVTPAWPVESTTVICVTCGSVTRWNPPPCRHCAPARTVVTAAVVRSHF